MKFLRGGILLTALIVLYCLYPFSVSAEDQNLAHLLKARKYDQLESILKNLQKGYEADFRNERPIRIALAFLESDDQSLESYLNEWVSERPLSWCAYLSRGAHYWARGWTSRGSRWYEDTLVGKIVKMRFYFEKARRILKEPSS